jgi:hypothetical protein
MVADRPCSSRTPWEPFKEVKCSAIRKKICCRTFQDVKMSGIGRRTFQDLRITDVNNLRFQMR